MTKVLFIDDQIDRLRPLLGAVMNYLDDIEIMTADNGLDGLILARQIQPDIIFLDIAMPEMNGFDVCRNLKKDSKTKNITVLFLSSMEMTLHEQMEALDLGAVDFIRKPISSIELASRIRVMNRFNAHTSELERLVLEQTKKIEKQSAIASRTERLAAMGTLAAGIAHEVNQPLNALKVTADGLLYWKEREQTFSEEEIFEGLAFISEQANRIDEIIRHMRDLVQSHPQNDIDPVYYHSVVERAMHLVGRQLKAHNIEVINKIDENHSAIQGNSTQLEQAIINLMNNAMNAIDQLEKENKHIIITSREDGDCCQLIVEDNGPGIPVDCIEQIFDPFFTKDSTGRGMGLGLSITQNLVTNMNGTLSVKNNEKEGATFTISLPIFSRE